MSDFLELIRRAVTEMPEDVLYRLRAIPEGELKEALFENIRIAAEEERPICQDTGLLSFFIEFSDLTAREIREIEESIKKAVVEATKRGILRPNAIERPHRNTGNNLASGHPSFYYIPSDRNRVRLVPKGGGSIYVSRFYTLKPIEGEEAVRRLIVKTIAEAGSKACPPYFVFSAAGGSEEASMLHAKLLMLRDLREPRTGFEEETLERINSLGIGFMGLGIGPTALDFRIEFLAKHPAVTTLSVIVSCRALRKAFLEL